MIVALFCEIALLDNIRNEDSQHRVKQADVIIAPGRPETQRNEACKTPFRILSDL
jgi:hypothetical protein